MIGIPNELMPGLPSSRMTLKVFYSESVAVVLVNLCWRMRRPCVLSQVLNDATTSSVRTRVSSITMPPKPWLGFQLRYKNLILFVRVAKSRSRIINRLGFIYSICWLREHSTPQQHFFQFSLNSIYILSVLVYSNCKFGIVRLSLICSLTKLSKIFKMFLKLIKIRATV